MTDIQELQNRFSRTGRFKRRFRRIFVIVLRVLIIQSALLVKRLLDIIISFCILMITFPIIVLAFLLCGASPAALSKEQILGKGGVVFRKIQFNIDRFKISRILRFLNLYKLPVWWNVLKGDMSIVGPEPYKPDDVHLSDPLVRKRLCVPPGLICLWWIRKRANINFDSEFNVDEEYVETRSLKGDLGILLRSIPAVFYGESVSSAPDKIEILGIPVNNVTMDESIEFILKQVETRKPCQLSFLNAHCANVTYTDWTYYNTLLNSRMVLADGIGLKLAGKILNREIRQNVNGTDLFPELCKAMATQNRRIFLLGARPGITDGVVQWIKQNAPGCIVAGHHHGYFSQQEEPGIIEMIRNADADVLMVAFGVPRQDKWVENHLHELDVPIAMGVGGLFDFYSGRIQRAPQWVREIGMEWFYRFLQEPGRMWKRYFWGNGIFLWRVFCEKVTGHSRRKHALTDNKTKNTETESQGDGHEMYT